MSCVTLINVLYASLTPRNQIVRLKGAHYYHAELFGGSAFSLLKNVTLTVRLPASHDRSFMWLHRELLSQNLSLTVISRGEEGNT